MKISSHREKGYEDAMGKGYRVTLNGHLIERVLRADTCTGVAWVYATDADGSVRIDRAREEAVVEKWYGSIRILPPEDRAAA